MHRPIDGLPEWMFLKIMIILESKMMFRACVFLEAKRAKTENEHARPHSVVSRLRVGLNRRSPYRYDVEIRRGSPTVTYQECLPTFHSHSCLTVRALALREEQTRAVTRCASDAVERGTAEFRNESWSVHEVGVKHSATKEVTKSA